MSAATPRSIKNYQRPYSATTKAPMGRYNHFAFNDRCGAGITRATKAHSLCAPTAAHGDLRRGMMAPTARPGPNCTVIVAPRRRHIRADSSWLQARRCRASVKLPGNPPAGKSTAPARARLSRASRAPNIRLPSTYGRRANRPVGGTTTVRPHSNPRRTYGAATLSAH